MIAKIGAPYGVKGWFKVHSYTEPVENFLVYQSCYLQGSGNRGGSWQTVAIEASRRHGKGLVAKLKGVDNPEQAREYGQCELAVARSSMPALEEGDYYWHQLEGLTVRLEADPKQVLGKVDHLLDTGANDVLVVKACRGSMDKHERLIPYLPGQVVTTVDLALAEIRVDWDPEF